MRMGEKMRDRSPAMRYFNKTQLRKGRVMSRKDGILLASRTLAVLVTVWALAEVSYLPGSLHSFLHYVNREMSSAPGVEYMRHLHFIALGFLITRIVGFSLVARWLYNGGPEIDELLLPGSEESVVQR